MSKQEIKKQLKTLEKNMPQYYNNVILHGAMMLKYRELKQQLINK